jgi:HD-GYP domain-containing protein (c-di-GMP phosphodiesterase class II)
MKVSELRRVVSRLQASHSRYRDAKETVQALQELAAVLQPYDKETVAAFVKRLEPNGQAGSRRQSSRRRGPS